MGQVHLDPGVSQDAYLDWLNYSPEGQEYADKIAAQAAQGLSVSHRPPADKIKAWAASGGAIRAYDDPSNPNRQGRPKAVQHNGRTINLPAGISPSQMLRWLSSQQGEAWFNSARMGDWSSNNGQMTYQNLNPPVELLQKFAQASQPTRAAPPAPRPAPRETAAPRPPQETDPIRKLIEDARKQMDMQDRLRDAQQQIQLEALQREAMRTGQQVMWEDGKPYVGTPKPPVNNASMRPRPPVQRPPDWQPPPPGFTPSPHPDFTPGSGNQFQVITHWHNPGTGETVAMPNPGFKPKPGTPWRPGRAPEATPGKAQPIAPPSQGTPYGEKPQDQAMRMIRELRAAKPNPADWSDDDLAAYERLAKESMARGLSAYKRDPEDDTVLETQYNPRPSSPITHNRSGRPAQFPGGRFLFG